LCQVRIHPAHVWSMQPQDGRVTSNRNRAAAEIIASLSYKVV